MMGASKACHTALCVLLLIITDVCGALNHQRATMDSSRGGELPQSDREQGDLMDETGSGRRSSVAMHPSRQSTVTARAGKHAKLEREHAATRRAPREQCTAQDLFSQTGHLPGAWMQHEDPEWQSYYGSMSHCPEWTEDFDCLVGSHVEEHKNAALIRQEYRKIFRPHKCDLAPFDDAAFDQCLAGRRLIMIGDSTMNGLYVSLGCLMRHLSEGAISTWDVSTMTGIKDEYQSRIGPIQKQVTGEMDLEGGGRIIMRGFGRFNISLWDEVLAELEPITEADTILVNFGSWYNRLRLEEGAAHWEGWRADMQELVSERLASTRAAVVWKGYTTFHYAGETGAFTGVREAFREHMPPLQACQATKTGEFWFDEEMGRMLEACGEPCAKIGILPLFQASLGMHNSHFGSAGRGRDEDALDCTHYCHNAMDQWNTILFNYLCG